MRVALVNPPWSFEGSIYFGCREPHLPLELGYARNLLEASGHRTLVVDGHLTAASLADVADEVARFRPDTTVITTAPTYLFWRCAQPELAVPRRLVDALDGRGGTTVAIGPHGSATPGAALAKLGVDVVVRGEAEEVIAELAAAGTEPSRLAPIGGIAFRDGNGVVVTGPPRAARFIDAPPLAWPGDWIRLHRHHHHRFDRAPDGPGAEVEASRGCPFTCTFCAKRHFRDRYRRRDRARLMAEIDGLVAAGVTYLYFVDEIFLPDAALLDELARRRLTFGVQTRIDLWSPEMIGALGAAGCVSIEAGVESITAEGRDGLDKRCRLSTDELADRLALARTVVPFVQANLIRAAGDDPDDVARFRARLGDAGVWANDPVPLFPYPSSPDYRRRWGEPDDVAWERAHAHYLAEFPDMSDIQAARPRPLPELEARCVAR